MKLNQIVFIFLVLVLSSCISAGKNYNSNQNIFKIIYESQNNYYQKNIINKADFKPIIDFACSGRCILYKDLNLYFIPNKQYILLEGFVNSNGRYAGILFNDSLAIAYCKTEKDGWQILKIDSKNEDSLVKFTGINKIIIKKISSWDIDYINNLKNSVGNAVSDG